MWKNKLDQIYLDEKYRIANNQPYYTISSTGNALKQDFESLLTIMLEYIFALSVK